MKLTKFQKYCFTLSIFWFCLFLTGCSGTWITEGEAILGAVLPLLAGLGGFITQLGGSKLGAEIGAIGTQAESDLNTFVEPLIASYQSAAAADQPGIIGKIQAAMSSVVSNLGAALTALHIDNTTAQGEAEKVVTAIVEELQNFVNVLPALKTAAAANVTDAGQILKSIRAQGHELPLTGGQFKKHIAKLLDAKTGDTAVDAAKKAWKAEVLA